MSEFVEHEHAVYQLGQVWCGRAVEAGQDAELERLATSVGLGRTVYH